MSTVKQFRAAPSSAVAHSILHIQMERVILLGSLEGPPVTPGVSLNRAARQQSRRRHPILRSAAAILLAVFAFTFSARGQSTFGSIRGTVQDISQAVIPGATVTVRSLDQNFSRQTVSNDAGEFLVANLQPGHYSITIEQTGFSRTVIPDTQLDARQDLRIPVTLSV